MKILLLVFGLVLWMNGNAQTITNVEPGSNIISEANVRNICERLLTTQARYFRKYTTVYIKSLSITKKDQNKRPAIVRINYTEKADAYADESKPMWVDIYIKNGLPFAFNFSFNAKRMYRPSFDSPSIYRMYSLAEQDSSKSYLSSYRQAIREANPTYVTAIKKINSHKETEVIGCLELVKRYSPGTEIVESRMDENGRDFTVKTGKYLGGYTTFRGIKNVCDHMVVLKGLGFKLADAGENPEKSYEKAYVFCDKTIVLMPGEITTVGDEAEFHEWYKTEIDDDQIETSVGYYFRTQYLHSEYPQVKNVW